MKVDHIASKRTPHSGLHSARLTLNGYRDEDALSTSGR